MTYLQTVWNDAIETANQGSSNPLFDAATHMMDRMIRDGNHDILDWEEAIGRGERTHIEFLAHIEIECKIEMAMNSIKMIDA